MRATAFWIAGALVGASISSPRAAAADPPATPSAPAASVPPAPSSGSGPSTATWILGGVALYGIVTFIGFNVAAATADPCGSADCPGEQHERVSNMYFAGEVAWVAGLLAAGTAIYLAFVAPARAAASPPAHAAGWPLRASF